MLDEMVAWQSPVAGAGPFRIGSRSIGVSLQPAIPRRVAPQQSPPPLHQSPTIVTQSRSSEEIKIRCSIFTTEVQFRPLPSRPQPTGVSSLLCAPGDISILR